MLKDIPPAPNHSVWLTFPEDIIITDVHPEQDKGTLELVWELSCFKRSYSIYKVQLIRLQEHSFFFSHAIMFSAYSSSVSLQPTPY